MSAERTYTLREKDLAFLIGAGIVYAQKLRHAELWRNCGNWDACEKRENQASRAWGALLDRLSDLTPEHWGEIVERAEDEANTIEGAFDE